MCSHSAIILTYSFKNTLVPNTNDLFKVFLWVYAVVYIYIFYSPSSYPIGMYKVYYSILISFIIKSIRLPLFFFFLFSKRHNEQEKNLFCYIKDKEISTCIISITVGLRPAFFLSSSYTGQRTIISMLYTYNMHWEERKKPHERHREKKRNRENKAKKNDRRRSKGQTSLIVHYCSARKNKVVGCLFTIMIIINLLYTRHFL